MRFERSLSHGRRLDPRNRDTSSIDEIKRRDAEARERVIRKFNLAPQPTNKALFESIPPDFLAQLNMSIHISRLGYRQNEGLSPGQKEAVYGALLLVIDHLTDDKGRLNT